MAIVIKLFTIITWILACYFMFVRIDEGYCKKDLVMKVLVSISIMIVALFANISHFLVSDGSYPSGDTPFHILMFLGLAFGMLADYYLGRAHLDPDRKIHFRKMGIILFGVEHIFNIAGMLFIFNVTRVLYLLVPFLAAAAFATAAGLGARKAGFHFGRYTVIVSIYIGLLSADAFFAWGLFGSTDAGTFYYDTAHTLAVGQAAFLISDASLAPMYFGKVGNKPHYVIFNHVTYYMAQLLIAYALI